MVIKSREAREVIYCTPADIAVEISISNSFSYTCVGINQG